MDKKSDDRIKVHFRNKFARVLGSSLRQSIIEGDRMTDQEKRIKLAEAMGWKPLGGEWDLKGGPPAWDGPNTIDDFDDLPNPFTNPTDDYAVLEWMRGNGLNDNSNLAMDAPYAALPEKSDYKIGDYARAALKVIT